MDPVRVEVRREVRRFVRADASELGVGITDLSDWEQNTLSERPTSDNGTVVVAACVFDQRSAECGSASGNRIARQARRLSADAITVVNVWITFASARFAAGPNPQVLNRRDPKSVRDPFTSEAIVQRPLPARSNRQNAARYVHAGAPFGGCDESLSREVRRRSHEQQDAGSTEA